MKRQLFASVVATFLICLAARAYTQSDFFYARGGKKVPITVSSDALVIKFKGGVTEAAIGAVFSGESALQDLKPLPLAPARRFYKATLRVQTEVTLLMDRLRQKPEVDLVSHIYNRNGLEVVPNDRFIVQFKPGVRREQVEALNQEHSVEIVETTVSIPDLFRLRVTNASDLSVIDMAKLYYESLPADWSLPDFVAPKQLNSIPNDTYFASQYYLHNTGQTGGTIDSDIDAPEAWDVTMGSSSIKIAVIDGGVSSHEDLPSSRIAAGYDYSYDDSDPSPGGNNAHGTAVAGIVAASRNNSLGIAGIAPNCSIMPIRIFNEYGDGVGHEADAAAIDFAWLYGADVISCSWTFRREEDPDTYPDVRDAIERALTQGRQGKGCVVVFAVGNLTANRDFGNYGFVEFPANVPGVIGVGAINKSSGIQYYSPRDDEIDLVAPTGDYTVALLDGTSQQRGDVWSLDIPDQPGYNPGDFGIGPPTRYTHYVWDPPGGDGYPPGNYTAHFGGTSAACPQVSGVAALVLSVNPDLIYDQIHEVELVLEFSADDLGTPDYDTDFGWGRINAHKALKYTLENYGGTLAQSFTIPAGETWNFQPGVTLKFANNVSLTVNGVINAVGNDESSRIVFTSANGTTPGSWKFVKVQNGNSVFKYCTFEYGTYSLYLNNATSATVVIENCIFQNNSLYPYLVRSKANVKSCEMKNNPYGLVCYDNVSVELKGNHIHDNPNGGVSSSSDDLLTFYGNVIENNGASTGNGGVRPANYAQLRLGYPYNWSGYNTVRWNNGNEVHAGSSNTMVYIAESSIHDASGYEVYNTAGNPQVQTLACYWDTDGCQKSGSVLVASPYNSLPCWDGQRLTSGPLCKAIATDLADEVSDPAESIVDPRLPDAEKIKQYKAFIAKDPFSEDARTAVIELYSIVRADYVEDHLGERKGFFDYLQEIRKQTGEAEVGKAALRSMIFWKMLESDDEAAIELSKQALEVVAGEDKKWVLVDLAFTYARNGQVQDAKNTLQELEARHDLDGDLNARIEQAIAEIEEQIAEGRLKPDEKAKPSESVATTPKAVGLSQNYPNPFNPSTTIRYSLPKSTHTIVTIYDMLGTKVRTLVNSLQAAGEHTVTWDGRDNRAELVASGVYFYRLEAGELKMQKKMVLLQ